MEIDVCDGCRGVWLDPGELEVLSKGKTVSPIIDGSDDVTGLRCPRCGTQRFGPVHVDGGTLAYCRDCGGLFVDGSTIEDVAALRTDDGPAARRKDATEGAWYGLNMVDILSYMIWDF